MDDERETTPQTRPDGPQSAANTPGVPEYPETPETAPEGRGAGPEGHPGEDHPAEEPETFSREYVRKLRKEAAEARVKARRADELARALFTARVAATGRLADPEDLPYSEDLLDDPDQLTAAIDELLADHPHYAARRPTGSIGQGPIEPTPTVNLADMLRSRA
ncbi:MAG: hypothetical protein E7Z97_07205 [Propionibacteriaceae bacterium]|nr:hypothetical protein [Propionibacteriaceae bacterium]